MSGLKPKDATLAVHGGVDSDPLHGAVVPPVVTATTFAQLRPGVHRGYDYTRAGNPTRTAYEQSLALLEGAQAAVTFASGLAAISALLQAFPKPGRVLVCDDVYGGTGRLFRQVFASCGWEFVFADLRKVGTQEKVDLVWVETPTNPLLRIVDIKGWSGWCKETGALLAVDNTFATAMLQKPLVLGADVVVHSSTKYIGGHTDLLGGVVLTNDLVWAERLRFIQMAVGAVPSPWDCALAHRSLKTLPLRMAAHTANALQVARWLEAHPQVARVHYPFLPSHPQVDLARAQMKAGSGVVSFELKRAERSAVEKFASRLRWITLAESLGGVESLLNHPVSMTHASVPQDLRQRLGLHEGLLRLSVGIEDVHDLIEDLDTALSQLT